MRLREIVSSAGLRSAEVVLDVGAGVEWDGIALLFALQMLMWPYKTGNEQYKSSDSELT